jgi:Family of unknown function (DUF6502)
MDLRIDTQHALHTAVLALLRPLCRLLLRHHVPFSAFEELAKHMYVQTALEDFGIPGKKPTLSRASILTGLTRKDVQRIVAEPEPLVSTPDEGYNRAARVLTGWARDADFHGTNGKPAPLHPNEGDVSFAALVRRYSGDMPVRAVLDELLRVGAVHQRKDERLELRTAAYVPQAGQVEKLRILGSDVADLITTIDHNLQHGAADPHFQRKVMYRNYPASRLAAFRKLSGVQSQALLERFDQWLQDHAQPDPSDDTTAPRMRLGVGIYYFEEPMAPEHPTGEKP